MSSGSWQVFADALADENRALGELGAAALALTSALVFGPPANIEAADRSVEAASILHARAQLRRTTMMKSGFGDLTLRQVCSYAPAPLRRDVYTSMRDLRTRGIALHITVGNNKALIVAGLARIAKTITAVQKALTDQTGMYRRRGTMTPSQGSVIVSRRA